jgi:hypothetical protein
LRKPNREVVGKALAETAERQAATTMSIKSEFSNYHRVDLVANVLQSLENPFEADRAPL